jgi:hypothetical protein
MEKVVMVDVPVHTTHVPHWRSSRAKKAPIQVSPRQRMVGLVLRSIFIVLLMVGLVHLSMPQSETIWTIFDTPSDVVRLALGLAMAVWVGVQLFAVPRDPLAFRTWLYTGIAAVPFLVICIIGTW